MTTQLDLLTQPAARRPQRIHAHSRKSYREQLETSASRAAQIYRLLRERGPMTDREIMQALGFTDMNAIRPRTSECIDAGVLREVGEKVCKVTGKTVRVVGLA